MGLGARGGRRRDARRRRLAHRHGPVPRRRARGGRHDDWWRPRASASLTTVCCAWRWTIVARGLGVDLSAARCRRRVLPLDVPQPDAARRRRRRRSPRRQPRTRRARRRPRSAGRRVGAAGRPTRPGRAHRRRPVRAAVAGATVDAARGSRAARDGGRRRAGQPGAARWRALAGWRGCGARSAATSATGCWRAEALPAIALASALVVLGHAATFLIAARAAGATAPPSRMLPLAFAGDAGHGAAEHRRLGAARGRDGVGVRRGRPGCGQGVATAVVYGVMVLVASLPGALVLVGSGVLPWRPRAARRRCPVGRPCGRSEPDA